MHIIPTQEEVVGVLRETGALRDGHFEYPGGMHSNEYLQVPLAMRYYQYQRMLSVGLSRLLRANPEIRAMIPQLSIVVPMTGGLPVAYGVTEALRARQVYWAEKENDKEPLHFRQYLEQRALAQPRHPEWRRRLGDLYAGEGLREEADAQYERAREIARSATPDRASGLSGRGN